MMFRALFVSSIVLCCVWGSSGQSYDNMTSLLSKVLNSYNTDVRPLQDQSGTVNVNLSLNLYNILDVNTVQGVITVAMGLPCTWHDERITWTSSDYGGISSIKIQQQHVWVPNLMTSKPVEFTSVGQKWMNVKYQADGFAFWNSAGVYSFACPMNIKYWPFDEQQCELSYFVYNYDDDEVLLQPARLYTDNLLDNGEWTLASSSIEISNRFGLREIIFSLKLKRRVIFYTNTLIIPLFFLSFLSCFVFLLPSESGERVSFCITILLSITVFMDGISDDIPKLSNPVPLLCQFLVVGVIMNSVVTILVVLNLVLYHRSNNVPIGTFYRFIVKLARCKKTNTVGVNTNGENKEGGNSKQTKVHKLMEKSSNLLGDSVGTDLDTGNGTNTGALTGTKPDCEVTWQDVSIALDRLYFIVALVASLACVPILLVMINLQL